MVGVNGAVEAGGALGGYLVALWKILHLGNAFFSSINLSLGEGGYNGTVDNGELHPTANECSIPVWLFRG